MSSYWLGILIGVFIGSTLGYFLCAIMFIAKQEDKRMGIEEGKINTKTVK